MELWLRVAPAPGLARDVVAEVAPEHTVEDLAQQLDWPAQNPVILARTGEQLDPQSTLDAASIRCGDTLRSAGGEVAAAVRHGQWCLVVAGGPATGSIVALSDGERTVGRSPQSNVVIDDPNISRTHFRVIVDKDSVQLRDENSRNGTFVQGVRVAGQVLLHPGAVIEAGDSAFRLHRHAHDVVPAFVRDGLVHFSRPPRLRPPRALPVRQVPAPPLVPDSRRIPLASALVPMAAAPVLAQSAGPAGYLLAGLSPLMVAASFWEEKRGGRKDHKKQLSQFRATVEETSAQLADDVRREAMDSWADHPDAAELLQRATGPSSRLWERRTTDPDFLCVRVGWADQPASATWAMADGGDAAERKAAAALLNRHAIVRSTPVAIDLADSGVVSIAGSAAMVHECARWVVSQAVVLHTPRDIVVAVAVCDDSVDAWDWIPWLPHNRPEAAPFTAHPYAVGDDEGRGLVAALNDLVTARTEQLSARSSARGASLPAVLVVFDERLKVPRAAVATLLESGPAVGVRVLWLGSRVDGLPGETRTIIDARPPAPTVTDVASGRIVADLQLDRFTIAQASALARSLAGVHDATSRGRGNAQLPPYVALPSLLGGELNSSAVQSSWHKHGGDLAAPIGMSETGVFSLDLRRDGPHALLGGTTGAGKSEMLQTLVASLAATIPPTRLTFLLVDYKGGAAFKDCVELPHVVGFVTDLDSHLVHRALISLNAELHRRERVLAAAGAKDLIEMERKDPDHAPASLLLVVDEFATLAKELPEFVDGVVNIAQRGRSLGIHMLLATQRPAGAINDNIRANTNLRMALRMNDEADSLDVIAARHAALLPRSLPGRAYIRTGASELTEVQVAYVGGHTLVGGDRAPLRVHTLSRGRWESTPAEVSPTHDDRATDLRRVVAVVRETHALTALPDPPAPWLSPLPELLMLSALSPAGPASGVPVGLIDLPARQAQEAYVIDLAADGSLLVFGSSGAGKTTLLRTLALSMAERAGPDRLHLYALDFASRGLGSMAALPQCGAVVNGEDIERVQRLFGHIERWISERKRLFAEAGCSSFEEYQRIVGADSSLARIVVFLESYGGFTSVFEKVDYGARLDAFPHLLSEGRPLGIHFVITADRPGAVPLAVLSGVTARLVLRLADSDDYPMLGLDARVTRGASLPPGRAFDQRTRELQIAVISPDPAGDAQAKAMVAAAGRLPDGEAARLPLAIGSLPTEVDLAPLAALSAPLRPVVGIGDRELEPVHIDLEDGHVLIAGPNRSGKSTALAAVGRGLRAASTTIELHLIAPRRTPLLTLGIWTSTARGASAIDEFCTAFCDQLPIRDGTEAPIVIVIDDGHELVDTMADSSLETIVRLGRDVGVYVVGASEVSAAQRSYGGWIREVRKDRHGLLLQPEPDTDGELLGAQLPRARHSVPGRAVLVNRSGVETIQLGR